MPKKWAEVENSPKYQLLSTANKRRAKEEYWANVVSVNPEFGGLSPQSKVQAKQEFVGVPKAKAQGLNTFSKKVLPTFVTGAEPLPGQRTIWGDVFERPAAAVREGIRSATKGENFFEGYTRGAGLPENVETFQEEFIRKSQTSTSPTMNVIKGFIPSAAGLAVDYATNPADILIDVLGAGVGTTAKTATKIEDAASSTKKLAKAVDTPITKSIRPSVAGKRTAQQVKAAKQNSRLAVDSIVDNKKNLSFIDDAGDVIKGELPKNLDEFSQAISQTKKQIFDEYSGLKTVAGEEKGIVFLDDIADELRKSVDNAPLKTFNPEAHSSAVKLADDLDTQGFFSVDEANDALELINQQLKAFYRNPDPKLANKNTVSALIANKLRTKIDNVITRETLGDGASEAAQKSFKALKKRYGALKSIENDANRRLVVDARKNAKGLIDFTDIYSGQEVFKGLMTQDPIAVTKGGVGFGIKKVIKSINDPNNQIKKMFLNVEKLKQGKNAGTMIKKAAGNRIIRKTPAAVQSIDNALKTHSGERVIPRR